MSPVLLTLYIIPIISAIVLFASLLVINKYKPVKRNTYSYSHSQYSSMSAISQILVKSGGALVLGILIVTGLFFIGVNTKTSDTEILNGEVTGKEREHGSYVESYDCNCRTVTYGSGKNKTTRRECDTCYRDHFTVTWYCYTNLGTFTIEHLDRTSRSVYNTPDPQRYVEINHGDPVSKANSYTNWIKAVPDSLIKPLQTFQVEKYAGKIPEYPGHIYDYYRIDRVLGVGINVPNVQEWNSKLSNALRTLGPQKQANVVILFTTEQDSMYAEAIKDRWVNGKKNDIIAIIGIDSFTQPAKWVKILALTDKNIFQVTLRDRLLNLDTLSSDLVINTIYDETMKSFKRKPMNDFVYLENEILPSTGLIITMVILVLLINIGAIFIKLD